MVTCREHEETLSEALAQLAAARRVSELAASENRRLEAQAAKLQRQFDEIAALADRACDGWAAARKQAQLAERDAVWRAAVRKAGQENRLCDCPSCADLLALMRPPCNLCGKPATHTMSNGESPLCDACCNFGGAGKCPHAKAVAP